MKSNEPTAILFAGPGIVMSIAYVDPANFEACQPGGHAPSDSSVRNHADIVPICFFPPLRCPQSDMIAGVQYGCSLLWVLLWATAAGFLIQTLAIRLALGGGQHLAQACKCAAGTGTSSRGR